MPAGGFALPGIVSPRREEPSETEAEAPEQGDEEPIASDEVDEDEVAPAPPPPLPAGRPSARMSTDAASPPPLPQGRPSQSISDAPPLPQGRPSQSASNAQPLPQGRPSQSVLDDAAEPEPVGDSGLTEEPDAYEEQADSKSEAPRRPSMPPPPLPRSARASEDAPGSPAMSTISPRRSIDSGARPHRASMESRPRASIDSTSRVSVSSEPRAGGGSCKAQEIELDLDSHWFAQKPLKLPSVISGREDVAVDVSESTSTKRGKTKHEYE